MDDLKEIQGIFYSNNNKNVIKGVINGVIKNKFKNYDEIIGKIIDETIEYVFLKRNIYTISKNTKKSDYIFILNEKVYDIIIPTIKSLDTKDNIYNTFDEVLMKNYEVPPIIDYPKPEIKNSIKNIDLEIKKLENDRLEFTPKINPIDFLNDLPKNEKNTMDIYNEYLLSYNNNNNDTHINNDETIHENVRENVDKNVYNDVSIKKDIEEIKKDIKYIKKNIKILLKNSNILK